MRIIKLALITIAIAAVSFVNAQQQAQYSMYMANNYTLNPAVGGTENYADFKMSYRTQWVGMGGQPKTMYLSGHTAIGKATYEDTEIKSMPFHGVGGYVYNDQIGATNKIGFYGSYAYHLPITTKLTASFGAFVGFQQLSLDASNIRFHDDASGVNDAAVNGNQSKFLPDANIGTWIYHKNWYAGGALYQLLSNNLDFEDVSGSIEDGKLNKHYFVTAGYRVPINDDFTWVPSFVMKAVAPTPIQFDINSKFRYQDLAWLGVSYRSKAAVALMVGATLQGRWDVAYSYDVVTSDLKNTNSGSHEFMLGYRLLQDFSVKPTSQFW